MHLAGRQVNPTISKAVTVPFFNTEGNYDKLTIGGDLRVYCIYIYIYQWYVHAAHVYT